MKKDTEARLGQFIHEINVPFTLKTLTDSLGLRREADIDFVAYWLSSSLAVLDAGELYISRPGMFSFVPFSVLPSRFEINEKIFIAGHRCIPFGNPDILPSEYVFMWNARELPRKVVSVPTNELFDYYYLHGEEFVAQYLCLDPANQDFDFVKNDCELPGRMDVTAVDMSQVFEKAQFKSGDRLVLSMLNWERGIFQLEVQKDTRKNPFEQTGTEERRKAWFALMEKSLLRSFELFGARGSIDEQIAYAYAIAAPESFALESGSVEELLRQTNKIETVEFGVETRLWRKGEDISAANLHIEVAPENDLSAINKLFLTIGVPVSESLLDSLILDSLYRREKNCDAIITRLFADNETQVSKKDMLFCLLHLEKRRAILQQGYNWFADYETGLLRQKILLFYANMLSFVYALSQNEVEPASLPQQPLVMLSQLFSHLSRMLESLSMEGLVTEKDISGMYLSLEGMEYSFEDLSAELEESAKAQKKVKFTVIKKEDENNE